MRRRLALACLLLCAAAPPPPLPTTLPGGSVIGTAALARLVTSRPPILIDVAPAPTRPTGMAAGAVWLPLPHRDIPGSVWIPDAGLHAIPPALDRFYRQQLDQLTRHDPNRPVVVYCHRNCRLSWNAARRTVADGYRRVVWYPDGVEGWQAAGLPVAVATPHAPACPCGRTAP